MILPFGKTKFNNKNDYMLGLYSAPNYRSSSENSSFTSKIIALRWLCVFRQKKKRQPKKRIHHLTEVFAWISAQFDPACYFFLFFYCEVREVLFPTCCSQNLNDVCFASNSTHQKKKRTKKKQSTLMLAKNVQQFIEIIDFFFMVLRCGNKTLAIES